MKAIILAGGDGTRLRAVTGPSPKPLVPLLGRPLMAYTLELLRRHGFTEVCAALRYRAQDIIDAFGDGSALGVSLRYRVETGSWGTAGAVRRCGAFIGGEDVLVISGDAACDYDLTALWEAHRERKPAATLALAREKEPLRFGLTVTDEAGTIRAFIEKPDWAHVVTDLVNTGIYVLSPRALEAVPTDRACDFARDLFPALLESGETLLGLPMDGYWCDVGTPLSYYRCCADALEGRLALNCASAFRPAAEEEERETEENGFVLDCVCPDRAWTMGALSEQLMELGADYADGLRLGGEHFRLHIRPLPREQALRVCVQSEDAELARELAFSARDVIRALGNGGA